MIIFYMYSRNKLFNPSIFITLSEIGMLISDGSKGNGVRMLTESILQRSHVTYNLNYVQTNCFRSAVILYGIRISNKH
jgi:hypothetical protein